MTTREEIREGIRIRVLAWYEDCTYDDAKELLARYDSSTEDGAGQESQGLTELAIQIMQDENSQGVVIKVERELPKYPGGFVNALWDAMNQIADVSECLAEVKKIIEEAGYSAWEPLIKESE